MSDDRELLELAAKAMGHRITGWNTQRGVEVAVLDDHSYWQPLLENGITDCMGDALRLAVKLNIQITPGTYNKDEFTAFVAAGGEAHEFRHFQQDEYAATRRAIVRAAAEIGKAMP